MPNGHSLSIKTALPQIPNGSMTPARLAMALQGLQHCKASYGIARLAMALQGLQHCKACNIARLGSENSYQSKSYSI
jgi:hypothetical protein